MQAKEKTQVLSVTELGTGTILSLDRDTLQISLLTQGELWESLPGEGGSFQYKGTSISFLEAGEVHHESFLDGLGAGIRSRFSLFAFCPALSFETCIWVEESTGDVFFEWIPLAGGEGIEGVSWPPAFSFEEKRRDHVTLICMGQGLLIPNDWEEEGPSLPFGGLFLTAGSYMPWFGQIRGRAGYIAIALTPWNGALCLSHPAGGPNTHVQVNWQKNLEGISDRRILRFSFRKDCDYSSLAKIYRRYVFENGLACTLKEKTARLPSVEKLVGACFVHTGIKTSLDPSSDWYNEENAKRMETLVPFEKRLHQMEELHRLGVRKLYLHLDGWGEAGYDQRHPDVHPACEEAGGYEGLRALADGVHKLGFSFGIHDQYRDYYKSAPSYQDDDACMGEDGSIFSHARWAGGRQSYLCALKAPFYVRRNFRKLTEEGIALDGAYLDVFTCNEGDECFNPRHRMSRRDCYEYRGRCFDYLMAKGILPSSEEVSDWSMRNLVFCHYAPYTFQLHAPGAPVGGIPVPLFSLVYHDCVVVPWMMEKMSPSLDYMLFALLNGGAPYLIRDAAYPGTDGAFEPCEKVGMKEAIERCRVVSSLHERVAYAEMLKHEFIDHNPQRQRSVFSDGTSVEISLSDGSWRIRKEGREDVTNTING